MYNVTRTIKNSKILLIFLLIYSSNCGKDNTKKEIFGVVFLETMFFNVALNDASAAIKVYLNELQKNIPLEFGLKPVMFKDNDDLVKNYAKENLAIINFSAIDYLLSKSEVAATPLFINTFKDSPYEEYLLLIKKDSKINTVADLLHKSVGMIPRKNNPLVYMWFKVLLAKNKVSSKEILNKISEGKIDSQNIMAVFFGQLDACIVSKRAFQVMTELNPQVARQLNILASSPGFVTSVSCFSAGFMKSPYCQSLYDGIIRACSYPAGQQMFSLMKTDKIIPFKEEYLHGVKKLINDYNLLERKKK